MEPDLTLCPLARVIAAKIIITAVLWAPLVIPHPVVFWLLDVPVPQPLLFANLLGAAYLALLAGYVAGLRDARSGRYPALVVRIGIVSNGLAALILASYGLSGAWNSWSCRGQVAMWGSLIATIGLTTGFIRYRRRG